VGNRDIQGWVEIKTQNPTRRQTTPRAPLRQETGRGVLPELVPPAPRKKGTLIFALYPCHRCYPWSTDFRVWHPWFRRTWRYPIRNDRGSPPTRESGRAAGLAPSGGRTEPFAPG